MSRVLLLTFAAAGLWPSGAFAVPEFPRALKRNLSLDYEPACGVCHSKGNTGIGTVKTPFGIAMRARGLTASDTKSIDAALGKLEADMVDSDGDGVIDVDELSEGTDPNSAGAASLKGRVDPKWGCSVARVDSGTAPKSAAWLTLLTAAIAVQLRARRRRAE